MIHAYIVEMIVQTIVQILFGIIGSVRKKDLPVGGLIHLCYLESFKISPSPKLQTPVYIFFI